MPDAARVLAPAIPMRAFAVPLAAAVALAGCNHGDKAAHAVAGAAIAAVATEASGSRLVGCGAALAAGAAKEAWDEHRGGVMDFGDLAATTAGCGITLAF